MKIGIPREIKPQEARVALLPSGATLLVRQGHEVIVQRQAGSGCGYSDEEYAAAGARMVNTPEEVFQEAELIVKVKEPMAQEFSLLRADQVLFTYLHLAANRPLTEALLASGITAVGYETVTAGRHLPLLEPMSEIAGRMSVIVGAYFLARHQGGKGVLLGGVPGVLPGRVVVIGGGTSGVNAARMATGLGADVTILEVDMERMRFLDLTMQGTHTLYSTEAHLSDLLPRVDLMIGAVLVPGARAPKLIDRRMLREMKEHSVFVDIAIDQGGCAETSRPTTHDAPTYVEEGVVHYCVSNMPGAYARTATQALTNVTLPYIESIAHGGLAAACERRSGLRDGINTCRGQLTIRPVADAFDLPYAPVENLESLGSPGKQGAG